MGALLADLWANKILVAAVAPWALAQIIKVPLEYLLRRRWDWGLLLSSGGMPSSHSALVTGAATAIGLQLGFDSPLFAMAGVFAMIVIYDAIGVRRQAGDHARVLNLMIDELLTGHPLAEKELKEVLGHTPREVIGGIALGVGTAYLIMRVL
ncbi:MAG: divergent PAP2 family protein [Anaerolineales bacterium]